MRRLRIMYLLGVAMLAVGWNLPAMAAEEGAANKQQPLLNSVPMHSRQVLHSA